MQITIIGTGYVGLTVGACFADMGHKVYCIDKNKDKIEKLNNHQKLIYEPYLFEMIDSNRSNGRLSFLDNLASACDSEIYFIAVGTPSMEDGSANLSYVLQAAKELGKKAKRDFTVVIKSTVPIGASEQIEKEITEVMEKRRSKVQFHIVSNPEFLKQGSAVNDFLRPDRIVIGCESEEAKEKMIQLYHSFTLHHHKMIFMNIKSAEMTKYVANAMLATKISFMNEIAGICDLLGANVDDVRQGIGSDSRIGYSFTYPGCGYGGSCFPKDVEALIYLAKDKGFKPQILESVRERNIKQKRVLFEKLSNKLKVIRESTIAVWGLSFKPETNDMREAPSIFLIEQIIKAGGKVKAYDPAAMEESKNYFDKKHFKNKSIELIDNLYKVLEEADALVLVTEWKAFRNPDFEKIKNLMNKPIIIDGRNQYNREFMEANGFIYEGIGR